VIIKCNNGVEVRKVCTVSNIMFKFYIYQTIFMSQETGIFALFICNSVPNLIIERLLYVSVCQNLAFKQVVVSLCKIIHLVLLLLHFPV
jgi:hypothetical protein